MPYFQDPELTTYAEREILPGLAEDCVTEMYERFGLLLDRTPLSLAELDQVLASGEVDRDSAVGPVGAYLGSVFGACDGARWMARFDRAQGADGYQASRLRLYTEEVDVFEIVTGVLSGRTSLQETFHRYHRPRS